MSDVIAKLSARPVGRRRSRPSLGLIGIGAFGEFCVPHLKGSFHLRVADAVCDLRTICERHGVVETTIEAAATCDVVVLAVPLARLRPVAQRIAPHLRPDSLVVDVCSVKVKPLSILVEELPPGIAIVGTHPLFGPQSGRNGIAGQRIAVCAVRGRFGPVVGRFLARRLGLEVIDTAADLHDRQMAVVQAVTHVVARALGRMGLPPLRMKTASFIHLEHLVDLVAADSDELFRSIVADNPFADDVLLAFRSAIDTTMRDVGVDLGPLRTSSPRYGPPSTRTSARSRVGGQEH